MKSYVKELSCVYDALFEDIRYAYPTMEAELDKDRARFFLLLSNRGLSFLTRDLPTIGKHLDRCLDEGAYNSSGLPATSRPSKRLPIPQLLRGLHLRVFEKGGRLKEDCDVQAVCLLRQFYKLAAKTQLRCSADKVFDEIENFVNVDCGIDSPPYNWVADHVPYTPTKNLLTFEAIGAQWAPYHAIEPVDYRLGCLSKLMRTLDSVSSILSSTLGPYKVEDWRFRHGPGVVSDLDKKESKYFFKTWSERLDTVFPFSYCAFHSEKEWAGHVYRAGEMLEIEPSSKLVDVPKTVDKPRLIAAEPVANMWCQQNLRDYMVTRVHKSWISSFVRFDDQTLNQRLCMSGSKDGSLITVDLSAASDRVSCQVVEALFRGNPELVRALAATRTRTVLVPSRTGDGFRRHLNKYSTMGNATTFPVETLVFLAISLAATLTSRQLKPTPRNIRSLAGAVSIFGDDIIVPTESRDLLYGALTLLGFRVNVDKSFTGRNFRESCGVDSFRGVDVTPAYWKGPFTGRPEEYARTLDTSNNFYKKFLVSVASYLGSTIGRFQIPLVPYESGFAGFKSFVSPTTWPFRSRWNKELQRLEYLVHLPIGKQSRIPVNNHSALLQFFTEEPSPFENWESGVPEKPRFKVKARWAAATELGS